MKRKASELDEDEKPQTISKRQVTRSWNFKAREATAEVRELTLGNILHRENVVFSQAKQFNTMHASRSTESPMGKLLLAAAPSWREKNAGVPCVRFSNGLCVWILDSREAWCEFGTTSRSTPVFLRICVSGLTVSYHRRGVCILGANSQASVVHAEVGKPMEASWCVSYLPSVVHDLSNGPGCVTGTYSISWFFEFCRRARIHASAGGTLLGEGGLAREYVFVCIHCLATQW